jgi:fatty acid desaturase
MEIQIKVALIIGVFSILLGLSVFFFKMDWIISGYNTLSKEKKEKVEISKIRSIFRNFFVFGGALLVINSLLTVFYKIKLLHPVTIVLLVIIFLTSNYLIGKYDHNEKGGMVTIYRLFHSKG